MTLHLAAMSLALAVSVSVTSVNVAAQSPAARDFDEEIRASLQAAKRAAGFEFLGTLVRTCLLPQSGGENTTDDLPRLQYWTASACYLSTDLPPRSG